MTEETFKKLLAELRSKVSKASDDVLYRLGYDDAINKACEWFKEKACCGWIEDVEVDYFIEQFIEAMKGDKK